MAKKRIKKQTQLGGFEQDRLAQMIAEGATDDQIRAAFPKRDLDVTSLRADTADIGKEIEELLRNAPTLGEKKT